MKATLFSSSISTNLGNSGDAMVENSQVFGQRNLWPPHFCTFCELVEGEENKLTTFSTWTIMLGCNESNIIFQQHLYKLGQLRRRNGRNSQVFGQRNLWPPHFCTFCELVEGEENKLTTFFTWTIMLGCNESNIIFQQHLCKLGQLRRSNSQVFSQAMKNRPTGHTMYMAAHVQFYHVTVRNILYSVANPFTCTIYGGTLYKDTSELRTHL